MLKCFTPKVLFNNCVCPTLLKHLRFRNTHADRYMCVYSIMEMVWVPLRFQASITAQMGELCGRCAQTANGD